MQFNMKNPQGEIKEVRTGTMWYGIIPLVGVIIAIIRKQGKLYTANVLLMWIGVSLINNILIKIFPLMIAGPITFILGTLNLLFLINLIINGNSYSYNNYKELGYEIEPIFLEYPEVKVFVENSKTKKANAKLGIFFI